MKDINIKIASKDIISELKSVGFDESYLSQIECKYKGCAYKLFGLKPHEANILKQLCLSLGFDCAVHRDTITCKCDETNAVIFASYYQLKNLCLKLEKQPFRLNKLSDDLKKFLLTDIMPLSLSKYTLDWSKPYIMGILNVTPDSFSDGGNYFTVEDAYKHAQEMISDGADIIDIGGESTRPNAEIVSFEEEMKRVIPVIQCIRNHGIDVPISIDTRNYQTAKAAIENGADIINDVSGLDYDKNLFDYVVSGNIPVIIMHSDKIPAVSSDFADYDIVEQVYFSLSSKINKLCSLGLDRNKIIADVGIGFGKSSQSCFELLNRHYEFTSLKVPMLLGISRKSFIRNTFNIDCNNSDIPTALYSVMTKGVNIHRVHNVKLLKQYLDYSKELL